MERFYFISYDRKIGSAKDLEELEKEIERLSIEDPLCVQYHLREGHIVQWLIYIGENESAKKLRGISDPRKAVESLRSSRKMTVSKSKSSKNLLSRGKRTAKSPKHVKKS